MNIHSIVHAPFEALGQIESWIAATGKHQLSSTHTYKNEPLPELKHIDLIIILGGPQTPRQLDRHPYLQNEIDFIKRAIDQHKRILGICLGAQLIVEALGGKTEKSPHSEIGIHPIELTQHGRNDPIFSQFPTCFEALHWHHDMPGLANELTWLAKSEGCPRQAFRYGDWVYGLQFHLELNLARVKEIMQNCPQDLRPDRYVQPKQNLLNHNYQDINQKMIIVLEHLVNT